MKREESVWLYGQDTKEVILIGWGHRAWDLMSFAGPLLGADRFGGSEMRVFYLPEKLLSLLYQRFAQANPSGVLMTNIDDVDALSYPPEMPDDERDRAYEAGEIQCDVFGPRRPQGRDPGRQYLPELFEPALLNRLMGDRSLDPYAERPDAPKRGEPAWREDKDIRWQDWWGKS